MVARLAVFDIDNTLLARNKKLLRSTITSIQKLKQQKINVAIATGRNLRLARPIIKALDLQDFILCNGSAAFANKQQVHQQTLTPKNVADLVAAADEQNVDMIFESLDGLHAHTQPQSTTLQVLRDFQAPLPDYAPDYYLEHPIYQAMLFYQPEMASKLPHADEFSFVRFAKNGVDVIPKVGSKAEGVAKLATRLNVEAKDIVAFGDNDNDREMLRSAGIGIAMGNAEPAIQACANLTTTDCDHDGIQNGLKAIGWI